MKKNEPKSYQQGWTEFFKLKFKVSPAVLIPRPETELLVEEVLNFVDHQSPTTILDIGTGSGCIAITLAKNLPNAKIVATDISQNALEIAKINSRFHQVENQIEFIHSSLLDFLVPSSSATSHLPDLIVANLPYIPSSRIPRLDPSVKNFEPKIALDGGPDGFDLYRKLFKAIKQKGLKPKLIIGEIDDAHQTLAKKEALKYFPNISVEVKKDLYQRPRMLVINNY